VKDIKTLYDSVKSKDLEDAKDLLCFAIPTLSLWLSLEYKIKSDTREQIESSATAQIEDTAWMPLSTLIAQLPILSDLTYNSPDQLAPCILKSLHTGQNIRVLYIDQFFQPYKTAFIDEIKKKLFGYGDSVYERQLTELFERIMTWMKVVNHSLRRLHTKCLLQSLFLVYFTKSSYLAT
jgi:hypothetical protein